MTNFKLEEGQVQAVLLTFEQVVADSQFVRALRLLCQLAKVKARKLALIAQLSVFKFPLEFKENHFFSFGAFLDCQWDWSNEHDLRFNWLCLSGFC